MPEARLDHPLSDRFADALACANAWHRSQARKGTQIPYVAHLLAVAALALEHGANENVAIAALLHDAVEDGGGSARLAEIRARFGDEVADIVWECSDTDMQPKPPWQQRKEAYIAHVATASQGARLVSMCDKLHNARSILADLRVEGDRVWQRFSATRAQTLWYYRELVATFGTHGASPLLDELNRVVTALEYWPPQTA
ncbi:MAG: bifunctional (p)ppGpp synthetase/guanosine-3',5'-bis(diphosphate) 3'-pyrophosphohydrolase [Deltaproteobacteria bacterium]|nr:bifunctional (p)ppGpp synthetase/guanosine-3',5'-bis(diphosphate) 3'-pyrophosphohydrolase [Deltaproteobacteria bacterium]